MRARWWALAAVALGAACSVTTDGAPCTTAANCPAGQGCAADGRCRPSDCSGCGRGEACNQLSLSCQARYALALTAPADGSSVGLGGVTVAATLRLGSLDPAVVPVPAEVQLLVDGSQATTLVRAAQDGGTVTYAGAYEPSQGVETSVELRAQLTDSDGTVVSSAPLTLRVDTVPPAVGTATSSCDTTPCLRDGVLTVAVQASDSGLASVTAALDVDGGVRTVALAPAGGGLYSAQLMLKDWPFPFFQRAVAVTVAAVDQAGNAVSTGAGAPVNVTRLRWSYPAGAPVTSPALLPDGGLVFGTGATADQLRSVGPDGAERWKITLQGGSAAGKGVRFAPAVGVAAVWAGADDGTLYGVKLDGTGIITSCGSSDATVYTPALRAGSEVAFAGSAGALVLAVGAGVQCNLQSTAPNKATSSVVLAGGAAIVPTVDNTMNASLVQFTGTTSLPAVLQYGWSAPAGLTISAPLAVIPDGRVVALSANGHVYAIDPLAPAATATPTDLAQLSGAADGSAAVDAAGDLIFGTNDGALHRLTPAPAGSAWPDAWAGGASMGTPVSGVALVAKDASGVSVYATTSGSGTGDVVAVAEVGGRPTVVWRTAGLAAGSLQFPVVAAPAAGAPSSTLPTLYAGSGDGRLYALVVDTPLDPASPWPKSNHDLRNTGNASAPLP